MKTLITLAAASLAVGASTSALANGSAAQGLLDLRQLNLVVFHNLTGGGQDVEGKAFIGGDLSAGTFNNADSHGQSFIASSLPALTVGGNVSGNVNIDNHNPQAPSGLGAVEGGSGGTWSINGTPSSLYVGGAVGNYNPNGQVFQQHVAGLQTQIAQQKQTLLADLSALSTALAALPATAGSSFNLTDPNNATFTAVNVGNLGYAVIDITASQLSSARNLVYNIPTVSGGGYLPTIINVTGEAGQNESFTANSNLSAYNPYVMFNFADANSGTTLNFRSQVNGSVLAPLATVSNSTPIEGSLVASFFAQAGEVHLGTFLGIGKTDGSSNDPAKSLEGALGSPAIATPEPATWMIMLAGFGIGGASLRRRRAIAA